MDSIDSVEPLPFADLHEEADENCLLILDEWAELELLEDYLYDFTEFSTHLQMDRPSRVRAISDFSMHSQQVTSSEPINAYDCSDVFAGQMSNERITAPTRFNVIAGQTSSERITALFHFDVAAGQTSSEPITAPGCFDVVTGRGQGILRLPGNKKYIKLVSKNKRVYAKCHLHDKQKVSKGIVAAIREVGGGFLQYDKQSQTYHDIGDKKALIKTSQALREGLKNIRLQIYSDLAAGRPQTELEAELLGSSNAPLPAERYFEMSLRMLQSLRMLDKDVA